MFISRTILFWFIKTRV